MKKYYKVYEIIKDGCGDHQNEPYLVGAFISEQKANEFAKNEEKVKGKDVFVLQSYSPLNQHDINNISELVTKDFYFCDCLDELNALCYGDERTC